MTVHNNNPWDLEPNHIRWLGETAETSPITFATLELGIRAGILVCYAYQRAGHDTPVKFVYEFAPPSQNPTAQYVRNVCDWTGYRMDQRLDFHQSTVLVPWAHAVFLQERGAAEADEITDAQILAAKALADAHEAGRGPSPPGGGIIDAPTGSAPVGREEAT